MVEQTWLGMSNRLDPDSGPDALEANAQRIASIPSVIPSENSSTRTPTTTFWVIWSSAAPGVRLVHAVAAQAERDLGPTRGSLVGFWSPPYASGWEIAGYHFHFIAEDRASGGHVLDCAGRDLLTQIQMEGSVHVAMPANRAFLTANLERDPRADLAQSEH